MSPYTTLKSSALATNLRKPFRVLQIVVCAASTASFLVLIFTANTPLAAASSGMRNTSSAGRSGNPPAGDPKNGKVLFEKNGCKLCHGAQGEGVSSAGTNAGVPRIASTSLALADFLQQVRKPKGQMPPFSSEKISDADLADVYAYLQTLKPPAEQPTSATSSSKGERLFKSDGCYECHGYQGQGSTSTGGSRLGPPRIPLSAFTGYIRQPTGQMPPYTAKVVSDEDVAEIYNFLKSVPPPPPLKSIPILNQ